MPDQTIKNVKNAEYRFNFYMNLRIIMKREGYDKTDFAASAHLSRSYFYSILEGKTNPTIETMANIATALDLPLYILFLPPK